jgi:hypothetical protein
MFWKRISGGTAGEFQFAEGVTTPEPPSFYARRNCWYGASSPSPREIADRDVVGVDKICWGSDYPHYEGTYPHSRKSFRHTFHDVDENEVRAMLGGNAAELYGFDLEKLAPLASRFGPTPEEVSVPLTPEEVPTKVHTGAFRPR